MAHAPVKRKEFPVLVTTTCFVVLIGLSRQGRLPGPRVYVVTPAPRHVQIDTAPNRGPYYYNSWRRDDASLSSTSTTPRPSNTHDLIFADFGADAKKSVRKLLERERVNATSSTTTTTTTTTESPDLIFADFESGQNRGKSIKNLLKKERVNAEFAAPMYDTYDAHGDDIHATYNKIYEVPESIAPLIDSTTENEDADTTLASMKVEDIWHVINNEKQHKDEDVGEWKQLYSEENVTPYASTVDDNEAATEPPPTPAPTTTLDPYYNFVFPGFNSNEDKATENESRAIRTESNIRFPYVNLKTYQMKNKPISAYGKKNNVYTNIDNFRDVSQPVRGEVQDTVLPPKRGIIDRYNPAQPYLPPSTYLSKNKQSAPTGAGAGAPAPASVKAPSKAVANLIPPPPPPPPPNAAPGDFPPPPDSYESFPPYAPAPLPPPPPAPKPAPASVFRPPLLPTPSDDSGPSDSDTGSPDSGYSYKPPSPAGGYLYQPPSTGGGYSYKQPSSGGGYSYKPPVSPLAPPPEDDSGPPSNDSDSDDSAPPSDDSGPLPHKPDFTGYSYSRPHEHVHGHGHGDDTDYPELIFNKPHAPPMAPMKGGGDDTKGMDMMPPPPPPPPADMGMGMSDSKPDFPNLMFPPHDDSSYKYHNHDDFDFDHYHHHHHHHTTTTTTTTTEMPRVNRFSYYYLGKKLYYLPLYFSVYFVVYVGALIIKAVLRHKIVYPNSWHAAGRSERSTQEVASASAEQLHEITRLVTNALMKTAEKYTGTKDDQD